MALNHPLLKTACQKILDLVTILGFLHFLTGKYGDEGLETVDHAVQKYGETSLGVDFQEYANTDEYSNLLKQDVGEEFMQDFVEKLVAQRLAIPA